MSDGLGLKNTFKEKVWVPLQQYRGSDGAAGKEIGLVDFMNTHLGMTSTIGQPLTFEDIFVDLGKDPAQMTLDNLLSLSGDVKYLAPEIVRQFILDGMNSRANYQSLVAGVESVDSLVVTSPWIKYADEAPVTTGEAETIAEASITWGDKSVRLAKKAIGLHWSDELILSVKIPILSYFLRRVGIQLGAAVFTQAVTTLVNGDQADTSDACGIIGISSAGTLAFADFVRAWVRGDLIGQRWDTLLTDEAMANIVLAISEFKTPQGAGSVSVGLDLKNRIIPNAMPYLISSAMDAQHLMLLDPSQAMIMLVFRGLLVESERIVMRQVSGTAASIIQGFTTIDKNARIILKKDWAFSGHAFPAAMTPLT